MMSLTCRSTFMQFIRYNESVTKAFFYVFLITNYRSTLYEDILPIQEDAQVKDQRRIRIKEHLATR